MGRKAQEVIVESHEEIELNAWRRGWREGWAAGVRIGCELLLRNQLEARFGRMTRNIEAHIAMLDDEGLAELNLRVLTESTLERVLRDVVPQQPGEDTPSPAGPRRAAGKRTRR